MTKLAIIETERLIIRPFELSDIGPSYEMNLDAEVNRYTGDGGVVSYEEIERRIKENVLGDYAKYGFGRMAVELKSTKEFIGFCGLKYLEDVNEVDLGYRFMSKFWGKGYATESGKACLDFGLNKLELKRVIAWVLPENIGSVKVLDKLGFAFEKDVQEDGMLVQQFVVGGQSASTI